MAIFHVDSSMFYYRARDLYFFPFYVTIDAHLRLYRGIFLKRILRIAGMGK